MMQRIDNFLTQTNQTLFFMFWNQVAFIFLFTSQFTVLINYLCAVDTTLRLLLGIHMPIHNTAVL